MRFYTILLFVIALLLNNCSSPSLFVHNEKTIGITANQKEISVTATALLKEQITLDRLYINRVLYALDDRNQNLVYEDVKTATSYKFQYDIPRTIGILFNTLSYDMIKRVGNLSFFRIKQEDKTLFLIAQNLNKKRIHLLYGLTQQQLQTVMRHVGLKTNIKRPMKTVILPKNKKAFLIHWNAKMIILDGLLQHMSMKAIH